MDTARVRKPTDKPRVERTVPFVRGSFWKGETFAGLGDAQRRAEEWCLIRAGLRVHGTTQRRPAEVFADEEAPRLAEPPGNDYDLPTYPKPKVHRDHHIEVDKALYSVPGSLIGARVSVRADSKLVKVFHRGQLIKTHCALTGLGTRPDPALDDQRRKYWRLVGSSWIATGTATPRCGGSSSGWSDATFVPTFSGGSS